MNSIPGSDPVRLLGDLDFVRSLARQLCRDDAEADDLIQATAAVAIAKAPADVVSWRAWLATVARNLLRNRRRAERVIARGHDALLVWGGERHAPSAAEVAAREELRRQVVAAVMALPEEFREVVLLRHYRGLDTRESARELGVPEATVRSRLKRGLDRLRQRLDAEHGGDRRAWTGVLLPLAMPTRGVAVTIGSGAAGPLFAVAALLLLATGGLWWSLRETMPSAPAAPSAPSVLVAAHGAEPDAAAARGTSGGPESASPDSGPASRVAVAAPPDTAPWTLHGSVVFDGERRQPVADAAVRLMLDLPGPTPHAPRELGTVRTGADGTFFASLAEIAELPDAQLLRLAVHLHVDVDGAWQQTPAWVMLRRLDPLPAGPVELRRGRFAKGRVVDPHGEPVVGASFAMLTTRDKRRVLTGADGRFVLEVGDATIDGGQRTMLAYSAQHGFSRAIFARVDPATDLRLGDVVVQHPLHELSGRVHHPDGEGAAGVAVEVSFAEDLPRDGDVVAVDGVDIDGFCAFVGNVGNNSWSVRTDDDGRFVVRTLRAGRHELRVDVAGLRQEVEVTVGTAPLDVVLGKASIDVRARDEFGLPVELPRYTTFVWRGAAADEAVRRYREGPDEALLLTGERLPGATSGPRIACQPDCFVVVAASWPLPSVTGTRAYGACRLGANEWRGTLDVRPSVPAATGALAIDVRDAEGAPVAPVLFKLRSRSGLPVQVDVPGGPVAPWTAGGGSWSHLPVSGRLEGLPCGELQLEVLAGVTLHDGQVDAAPFVVARQLVEVAAETTRPVRVQVERGVVPELVLRLPEPLPGERLSWGRVQAFFEGHDGAAGVVECVPVDPAGWPSGELPRTLELRGRSAVAPGTYDLRLPVLRAYRVEPTEAGEQLVPWSEHALQSDGQRVHLAPDRAKVTIDLRRS